VAFQVEASGKGLSRRFLHPSTMPSARGWEERPRITPSSISVNLPSISHQRSMRLRQPLISARKAPGKSAPGQRSASRA
jgi:hypothetical protein